jgi:putative membrane protein
LGLTQAFRNLPGTQRAALVLCALTVLAANINQPYPAVAPLHHIPTALLILAAPWLLSRWPLSNAAVWWVAGFFLLHTLGGRYTYTGTPYQQWATALFGSGPEQWFGWERNHYDRLVHFAFGLCSVAAVREVAVRYLGIVSGVALYVAVEFVMGASAIYEVIEWLLSILLAPDNVEAYNGQQGDIWDAQKDMTLAFAGALITAVALRVRRVKG